MNVPSGGRQILIHGIALVLAGLVWGHLVAPNTPYPRLGLGAQIQFETIGVLFIVLATLLLKLRHNVGPRSIPVIVGAAWLAWPMALSEAANAWWGSTQMLSMDASGAGATGGEAWQELVVTLTHIPAGIGLIVAWALLFAGFVRSSGDEIPEVGPR